jgi:hypothetical protein
MCSNAVIQLPLGLKQKFRFRIFAKISKIDENSGNIYYGDDLEVGIR